MPPRKFSRFTFATGVSDSGGKIYLTDYEPYRFADLADNRTHVAVEGDTLWTLAYRYFAPLPSASQFWWAIADFQPDPIHDPTLRLAPGRVMAIPSTATLTEVILNERRRRDS